MNALAWQLSPYLLMVMFVSSFAYIYDGLGVGLTWGAPLRNSVMVGSIVGFFPLATLSVLQGSPSVLWLAFLAFAGMRSSVLAFTAERWLARISSMDN